MDAVITPPDRSDWRAWLAGHHDTAAEVWVVIGRKHRAAPSVTHREAIEEAMCFGWIDSLARRHDDDSWRQRFSPRSPRSAWSNVNREIVERMTVEGRMEPAGLATVELARRTGTWSMLADAQNGVVPDDLRAALDAHDGAADAFLARSPSARRAILESLARAKRPDTRVRRIEEAIGRLADCSAGRSLS